MVKIFNKNQPKCLLTQVLPKRKIQSGRSKEINKDCLVTSVKRPFDFHKEILKTVYFWFHWQNLTVYFAEHSLSVLVSHSFFRYEWPSTFELILESFFQSGTLQKFNINRSRTPISWSSTFKDRPFSFIWTQS